jgi:hypothetical protein
MSSPTGSLPTVKWPAFRRKSNFIGELLHRDDEGEGNYFILAKAFYFKSHAILWLSECMVNIDEEVMLMLHAQYTRTLPKS